MRRPITHRVILPHGFPRFGRIADGAGFQPQDAQGVWAERQELGAGQRVQRVVRWALVSL
jgi:hypothetical protein